jgi:nitroimidazol reductase NimA-like FMN-containing flavoprotein (pyridoxamine 5'-phosphate oxidase superfamily)
MSDAPASPRTKVRRHPERGRYERAEVEAILDAAFYGHLAFALDGQPYALPMLYVRDGDQLFLHGSVKSRLIRAADQGARLCFTVTLIDGLVMARAAFVHSINYRSVVVLGEGRPVRERAEKLQAMDLLVDHIIPGRTSDARQANANELKATEIIALRIDEASAKVRTGPPRDKESDLDMPIWAGVLPVSLVAGEPVADEHTQAPVPDYVRRRLRPSSNS